jgi:membrane-bound metal-dependent hydrolase YbcI (DUF457 family)
VLGYTHAPLVAAAGVTTMHLLQVAGWQLGGDPLGVATLAALVGAVSGLLPDIDVPGATIANPTRGMGWALRRGLNLRQASLGAVLIILVSRLLDLPLRFVARRVQAWLGHRGATHSLAAAALFGLTVLLITLITHVWGGELAAVATAGYLSHLLADGLTYGGQPLYWPLDIKKRYLLPIALRVSAKSAFANLTLTFISMIVLLATWLPLMSVRLDS